jgi:hypothetical protein
MSKSKDPQIVKLLKETEADLAEWARGEGRVAAERGREEQANRANAGPGRTKSDAEILAYADNNAETHAGFNTGPPPPGLPKSVAFSSDEIVEALGQYRGIDYKAINAVARGAAEGVRPDVAKEMESVIENLDRAFSEAGKTTEVMTVYRGVENLLVHPDTKASPFGASFSDKGFVSTSLDERIASDFGALVKIRIPKGSQVIRMSDKTLEDEVLLPRNATFTFDKNTQSYIFNGVSA